MDIANYISELLGRHGKLSVPGLGYFTLVRVNGYYNNAEGKFYPPGHEVQFNPEPLEDDILVQHIAEKKRISLASSKYFTEKYITNLKQEVNLKEVSFADLGWFYTDHGQITFKPGDSRNNHAEFYGFAPVSLKKRQLEPEKPVVPPLPVALFSNPGPAATETIEQQEVYADQEDLEEPRSGSKTWLIALIIIVVLAAAVFGLYKYNPGLFKGADKPAPTQPKKETIARADSVADTNETAPPILDTPSKAISRPDTALNKTVHPTAAPKTEAAKPEATETKQEYVIFAGSFKTQAKSDEAVKIYKSAGVDARTWNGPGAGKRIKVIIGSFATSAEAETERLKLVKAKKISKDSYSQEINEKK